MAVAVGPRIEFLQDPACLTGRGIRETIPKSLRSCTLLFLISGVPLLVELRSCQGPFILLIRVSQRFLGRWCTWHVDVYRGAGPEILQTDGRRHRGTPVTSLPKYCSYPRRPIN
jgi:hypothetical protein